MHEKEAEINTVLLTERPACHHCGKAWLMVEGRTRENKEFQSNKSLLWRRVCWAGPCIRYPNIAHVSAHVQALLTRLATASERLTSVDGENARESLVQAIRLFR